MKERIVKIKEIASEDDIFFLYGLLKERTKEMSISFKMPTYQEHKTFVKSRPYHSWFVIYDGDVRVGTVYKTKHDEIGIQIKKEFHRRGFAEQVIPLMYELGDGRNLANINPLNEPSIALFNKLGFKLIQYTFELKEI